MVCVRAVSARLVTAIGGWNDRVLAVRICNCRALALLYVRVFLEYCKDWSQA